MICCNLFSSLQGSGIIPTSIFGKGTRFLCLLRSFYCPFLRQKIVGKERNGKPTATANKRFYAVRNVTQLKVVFA